jgi:hypothetical protein
MLRFRNVLGGLNLSPIASRDGGVKPAVDGDLLLLHGKRGVNAQFVLLRLPGVRRRGSWDGNNHIDRGQHDNGMEQDPRVHAGIVASTDRGQARAYFVVIRPAQTFGHPTEFIFISIRVCKYWPSLCWIAVARARNVQPIEQPFFQKPQFSGRFARLTRRQATKIPSGTSLEAESVNT